MISKYWPSLLMLFFVACTGTDKPAEKNTGSLSDSTGAENKNKTAVQLTGKVFTYGTDVGLYNCNAFPPIGDVRSVFYFFSDAEFVYQSDSPGVLYLCKGRYRIGNNQLALYFDGDALMGDENMETGKISFNKEKRSPDTLQFDLAECTKGFYFITGDTLDRYLAQDEYYPDGEDFQIRLQENKYWEMLGLKNRAFPAKDRTPKVIRGFQE